MEKPIIRLYHQEELDIEDEESLGDGDNCTKYELRMYGMDDKGKEYVLFVDGIRPSFWIKVPIGWANTDTRNFILFLREKVGKKYEKDVIGGKNPKYWETHLFSKLYGFDNYKKHKFIKINFKNIKAMRRAKSLWYHKYPNHGRLVDGGFRFKGHLMKIYECNLPTMLLYFHEQKILTSGWITFNEDVKPVKKKYKTTNCDYEYKIQYDNIKPLDLEKIAPLKKCSWDIEAKSSHGDFPIPKKSYKKLATELVDKILKNPVENRIKLIRRCIFAAFGYGDEEDISTVYLKPDDYGNINYSEYDLENSLEKFLNQVGNCEITKKNRNEKINKFERIMGMPIENGFSGCFPRIAGDEVTMIGSTFVRVGELDPYWNHMVVVGDCDDIPEVPNRKIDVYDTEKELLIGWAKMIGETKPNIMLGYYIFGFDWKFLIARVEELNCKDEFMEHLSRYKYETTKVIHKTIKVASGTHDDVYIKIEGCLQIDLASYFRKNVNLDSYKLDNVAANFIGDKVKDYVVEDNRTLIISKNLMGLKDGDYIGFKIIKYSTNYYKGGKKFMVYDVDKKNGTFYVDAKIKINKNNTIKWCMKKDDVTPEEMFNANTPSKRAKVAKYCYQDCNLVHNLFIKNDIYTEFCEMANLCSVPLDYIIMRGQGIKCFSFIIKKCREQGVLVPAINKGNMTDAYEGAICLPPKCAFYADNPIAVNDYSSLYPSSMISENISHDSKVWWKKYDLEGNEIDRESSKEYVNKDGSFKYDNLEGYDYVDIEYDSFEYYRKNPKAAAEKILTGKKVVRFAQPKNGAMAVMPSVLTELLAARKNTKKQMKACKDPFMKNVLDKRQLSIKVTANSLYGQCGAKTSSFYELDIAAATTAIGRKNLMYAKAIVERNFKDYVYKDKYRANAEYIYGDTDSVFYTFNLKDKDTGEKIIGKEALKITIEMAKIVEDFAGMHLKGPHTLEYEKTFLPLLLLSKKRYVGMLYEEDLDYCYRKEMGIVLKRRDNAPCVKDCYGGVVDILMKENNVSAAVDFVNNYLNDMLNGHVSMDKLIISKKLNSYYKNPNQIAHKVLADRMTKRDPGNKPATGSRLPYIYIKTDKSVKLQGNKIETPQYIKKMNLEIDYEIYVTNQLMKPLLQLFGLVLEYIPKFKKRLQGYKRRERRLKTKYTDIVKYNEEISKIRDKEVKILIFDPVLKRLGNKKSADIINLRKQQDMMQTWFKTKK